MRRIALDTNLLVLLCVGSVDRQAVPSHKRTSSFSAADWDLLFHQVSGFDRLVTTAYVVAETSNFLKSSAKDGDGRFAARLVAWGESMAEVCTPVSAVLTDKRFGWMGASDTAWLLALADDVPIFTADARLAAELSRAGKQFVVKFPEGWAVMTTGDAEQLLRPRQ